MTAGKSSTCSGRAWWMAMARASDRPGEPAQEAAPALVGAEHLPHLLGALGVVLELAVLELDTGAGVVLGGEAHLDLGVEAGVVRPLGRELPDEHDALGRLTREHAAPLGLAAVLGALVPPAALARLDDRRGHRPGADRVRVHRPPRGHPLGEDREGALARSVDDDAPADGDSGLLLLNHRASPLARLHRETPRATGPRRSRSRPAGRPVPAGPPGRGGACRPCGRRRARRPSGPSGAARPRDG